MLQYFDITDLVNVTLIKRKKKKKEKNCSDFDSDTSFQTFARCLKTYRYKRISQYFYFRLILVRIDISIDNIVNLHYRYSSITVQIYRIIYTIIFRNNETWFNDNFKEAIKLDNDS